MVWGCMSPAGIWKFYFINGITDGFMYMDILHGNLYQSAAKLDGGDPKHTSNLIEDYFTKNTTKRLQTKYFIIGLNSIKHLWSEIKNHLRKIEI